MATLGAVDRANESVEKAMQYAKTQGKGRNGEPYYFINLVLRDAGELSGDPEHFAITGFMDLSPLPPRPDKNGKVVYDFNEEKGGYTRFRPGFDGVWRFSMWDDPGDFNRRFLASHWEKGYWDIEDPILEDQIFQLYEEMKAEAKKEKTSTQRKLETLQKRYRSAKENEKKGIMEEMQGLMTQHENKELPPPPKGQENKKRRQKYRIPPTPEQLAKVKGKPLKGHTAPEGRKTMVRVDDE